MQALHLSLPRSAAPISHVTTAATSPRPGEPISRVCACAGCVCAYMLLDVQHVLLPRFFMGMLVLVCAYAGVYVCAHMLLDARPLLPRLAAPAISHVATSPTAGRESISLVCLCVCARAFALMMVPAAHVRTALVSAALRLILLHGHRVHFTGMLM